MDTILVVGAGFAGSVMARCLAENNHKVLLIDKRSHVGGNAYDERDSHGLLVHLYGPHIFHTNSERIFKWLSRFTEWRNYEHRVRAVLNGKAYPFPINRDTLNQLYDFDLDEVEAGEFLEKIREPREKIITSEDVILNSVGRDLYEKFYRNYTIKQWGLAPSELKAAVAARIPTRTNKDDRYFTDKYQLMPLHGYTKMFESMLNHENISMKLGVDYLDVQQASKFKHVVYTGPIDAYFNFCCGALPYRSLQFQHEHLAGIEKYQEVGTINYPNDNKYTRITEFKHLTGDLSSGTSIVFEYPTSEGDPYYPIPTDKNEILFKRYEQLAQEEKCVTFVGRLAEYRYYNMDQVVGAALNSAEKLIQKI